MKYSVRLDFSLDVYFCPYKSADIKTLTFIAHFPPLEVEHCVVVGMDGQI